MAEKRKLLPRITDTIADIARFATGSATPGQIRRERSLEALQPQIDQLELARKNLENEQLTNIISALKQGMTEKDIDIGVKKEDVKAFKGVSPGTARFFETELPESKQRVAGLKQGMETETAGREDIRKLSGGKVSTPAGAGYDINQRQVAGSGVENLAMIQQLFPEKSQRAAFLATLKTAGYDTSAFERIFGEEEAGNQAKLKQILDAEEKQKQVAGAQPPSRFKQFLSEVVGELAPKKLPARAGFEAEMNKITPPPPRQPVFAPGTDFGFGRSPIIPQQPVGQSLLNQPPQEEQPDPIQVLLELMKRRQQ